MIINFISKINSVLKLNGRNILSELSLVFQILQDQSIASETCEFQARPYEEGNMLILQVHLQVKQ